MTKQPTLAELVSLEGQRALITGAAAGIGQAIARRFAEAGADLQLVDMDGKCLATTRDELARFGTDVTTHTVDLSHKSEIDALWAALDGRAPDILVNNVGMYPLRDFLAVDEAFYQKVLDVNLHSAYWMCQQMIGRRMKAGGGVIINVGSIEAVLPFKDGLVHYSMSKAGVIALTRALAKEHAKDGFRVNAILPGGIVTRGTLSVAKEVLHFKFGLVKTGIEFSQRLPVGRMGQPDEVARMALALASGLASYVHGAAIPVDGGFLAA